MVASQAHVTSVLARMRVGDRCAPDDLFRLVHGELHAIAINLLKGERRGHTLQTTALINEAAMRLLPAMEDFSNRRHFFGAAVRAMRLILVDYARQRLAKKRGQGIDAVGISKLEVPDAVSLDPAFLVSLNDALEELHSFSPSQAEVFEFWYFGGRTTEEIAQFAERSQRAVQIDLKAARAWLYGQFGA